MRQKKHQLLSRTETYAKWEKDTTAEYRIVLWTQKHSDGAGLDDDKKTYDFAEAHKLSGTAGDSASVREEDKNKAFAGFAFSRCDGAQTIADDGSTVLNVYYDLDSDSYAPSGVAHTLTYLDSVAAGYSGDLPKSETLAFGESAAQFTPSSGRAGYQFKGWYYDEDCTMRWALDEMPDRDLTVYAGWESVKNRVIIDPNYGAFPDGSTASMWFNGRADAEPIQEYLNVTRDYVKSSSGSYFYVKHDLAYYGGNAPDGVPRNEAYPRGL